MDISNVLLKSDLVVDQVKVFCHVARYICYGDDITRELSGRCWPSTTNKPCCSYISQTTIDILTLLYAVVRLKLALCIPFHQRA